MPSRRRMASAILLTAVLLAPVTVAAQEAPTPAAPAEVAPGATGATGAPADLVPPIATDITASTGLWDGPRKGWFGTYPQDWDGDGDIDVLVAPHGGTRYFMENDGTGQFTEIYRRLIPPDDRHGCAWGDPNVDGRPDIYCVLGAGHGLQRKENELFIQQPDGTFEDSAKAWKATDPLGRGREAGWVDANDDQWPDLYVSNQYPRGDGKPSRNRLYLGVDGTRFRDAPGFGANINGGNPLNVHGCVVAGDIDDDGFDDLITCGRHGLIVLRNTGGNGFSRATGSQGVRGGLWYHAQLADMNGDGKLDLVGVGPLGLIVQIRQTRQFGAPIVRRFSEGRQVAVADVNDDGALDVYVVRGQGKGGNLPDLMLLNAGAGRRFRTTHIPQIGRRGVGDSVSTADITGDGYPEMIVTHGGEHHKGPLQVISFTPGI